MNFGKTFKTERERIAKSRPEMAKMLGMTASALWKIEANKSLPKYSTIERFCDVAHIPLAYFYIHSIEMDDFYGITNI